MVPDELEGIADAHDQDFVQRQTDLLRESLFCDRPRGQHASNIEWLYASQDPRRS